MNSLRVLWSLVFEPQRRPVPARLCPTLAQLAQPTGQRPDNGRTTTVVVSLAMLKACRPGSAHD